MPKPSSPSTLQDLLDRARISDTILNYATGVDRRDWALYRSIFADEVEFDFEAWLGEPPRIWSADEWLASVRDTLAPFDATSHMLTNHVITLDGNEATLVAHMVALHYFEGEVQELGGFYTHRLRREGDDWKIFRCRLVITWERGSRDLFARAKARGPRPRIDVGAEGM
jgi:3-phenylpropionate/cinnamic acid dioxygenase small subunit